MEGTVLKSFFVQLGFDVDDQSLDKFNKGIKDASKNVADFASSITESFETVSTAIKIGAAAVVGSAAAIGYGISKISADFEQMGYDFHLIAPAINKALVLRQELLKAYSAAGINIIQAIQSSVKFNMSLAKTKFALEAIYKSVGTQFLTGLTKAMDIFRQKIYANMPRIQKVMAGFVKIVFALFNGLVRLATRLFAIFTRLWSFIAPIFTKLGNLFKELDERTHGWLGGIVKIVAVFGILAALLSPLIAVFVVLLGIFDDFETFSEGGKSLFNWKPLLPTIKAVKDVFSDIADIITDVFSVVGNLVSAFVALFHLDFSHFSDSIKSAFKGMGKVLEDEFKLVGPITDFVKSIATYLSSLAIFGGNTNILSNEGTKAVGGLFGGGGAGNVASNVKNNPVGQPVATPVGGNVQNANSNQNVTLNQQTQINVSGAADANAVGRSVSGAQGSVNFTAQRNLTNAVKPAASTP